MRSVICLALLALASVAGAGSIRPAAVVTSTDEDTALKGFVKRANKATCASVGLAAGCTDAQAKAAFATCANTGLPPTCTPAEAQAAAVAAGRTLPVIYAETAAGYQDYSTVIYASMVHGHAAQEIALRASRDVAGAYKAASPSVQAQVDALLGTQ